MNKYACIVLSSLIISLMVFLSILIIQDNRTRRIAFENGYEKNSKSSYAHGWFKVKD